MSILKDIFGVLKDYISPGEPVVQCPVSYGVLSKGEVRCDLHCHPHIACEDDLIDVFEAMHANETDLVAIATHGKGADDELTYREVKRMIDWEHAGKEFSYEEHQQHFSVTFKGRRLNLVGACSTNVSLGGVGGLLQIVSLMPQEGFEDKVVDGMPFKEYIDIARGYDAITVASQPYVLVDEDSGLLRKVLFRVADEDERRYIRTKVFPKVDCVELVGASSRFTRQSEEMVVKDFNRRPILSSGIHAHSRKSRHSIGTSGTIFVAEMWYSPREQLRYMIGNQEFRTYSPRQSLADVAVSTVVEKARELLPGKQ